jgi:hypothetical protein
MTRYRCVAAAGWRRCGTQPIIMQLPEEVQKQECWQIAVENLINGAEIGGGWLMFSRIAMMRALNEQQR